MQLQFNRENLSQKLLNEFMEEIEEEKNEEEAETREHSPRLLKIFAGIIISSILGFGIYALVTDKIIISRGDAKIPLVKAITDPVREKPEDPGGMYIANRDKEVYEAIEKDSGEELPKVVRLLPQPEEPIKPEEIKKLTPVVQPRDNSQDPQDDGAIPLEAMKKVSENTGIVEMAKVENKTVATSASQPEKENAVASVAHDNEDDTPQKIEDIKTAQEKATDDVAHKNISTLEVAKNTDVQVTKPAIKVVEQKSAAKPANITVKDIKVVAPTKAAKEAEAKEDTSSDKKAGYRMQLGSFRSEGDANTNWIKIKNKYASLLGNMKIHIAKASVDGKGTFYRLQVGSFDKESDARKICNELTSQGQGCFVAKK